MAKTEFKTVDEYIAAQPNDVRAALSRVRRAIRKALPHADEVISYNMPTYTSNGGALLHFAGWKTHFALYAASKAIVEQFESELAGYQIEKGTIRFPLSEPVPEKLIERIAKFRAREAAAPTAR
jgi:uncharacterized protein YdhG (YjbR/CyaY superfamily)